MKKVFTKTHFDKERKPKRLEISVNKPHTSEEGYFKEGNIIISILSKEISAGFQLSTGDVADIVSVLADVRKELLADSKKIVLDMGN